MTGIYGSLSPDQTKFLDNLDEKNKTDKLKQNQEMGRDQFLNVLLTQLANQNPLDPLKDKDFIAQMAQFSSVESMQALNKSFDSVEKNIASIKDTIDTMQKGETNGEQLKLLKSIKQSLDEITNANQKIKAGKSAEAYQRGI